MIFFACCNSRKNDKQVDKGIGLSPASLNDPGSPSIKRKKPWSFFPLNEDTEPKYFKRKEKNEFFLLSPRNKVLMQLAPAPLSMVNGLRCWRTVVYRAIPFIAARETTKREHRDQISGAPSNRGNQRSSRALTPNDSLSTISIDFNSLFRVVFHLSLAVLVNYRSPVSIFSFRGNLPPI